MVTSTDAEIQHPFTLQKLGTNGTFLKNIKTMEFNIGGSGDSSPPQWWRPACGEYLSQVGSMPGT